MITHKKHVCQEYIKKVKTGLIRPKPKLADFFSRRRFVQLLRQCGWCGAQWFYNEELPPDQRMYLCPGCELQPYEHPKYGDRALTIWAHSHGKEIPERLRKYLK